MQQQKDCVIIGAGMAGLTAASHLNQNNQRVIVLDKGRSVGGRTATRRFDGGRFDHGAQYFTVRDARFQTMVDGWLADSVIRVWGHGFPKADGTPPGGEHPRYRGADGMTAMAKALSAPLDVHTNTRVTALEAGPDGWRVYATDTRTDETRIVRGRSLLLTPPAEQSLALLAGVALPADVVSALQHIEYNPCFAVLATLESASAVPAPGGVFMPGEPISWIADNQQKGISDTPTVTIHAGPTFTRDHYNDDPDQIAATLIDAARDVIGPANVIDYQIQRWRYSQPITLHPEKTLFTAQPALLAFAGDAFNGARIEGAVLSGLAAADTLLEHLA